MSSNNGSFTDNLFTQNNGTTVGGPESASVIEIFWSRVHRPSSQKNGGPLFLRIGRDIEMIHGVWNITERQLETFTGYLNSNVLENKIKFTRETSKTELVFLDTKMHLKDGLLISEIYC